MLTWLAKFPKPLVWLVIGLGAALLVVFGLWRHARQIVNETKAALEIAQAERDAARRSAERDRQLEAESRTIREEATKARAEVEARTEIVRVEAAKEVERIRDSAESSGTAADLINERIEARERGEP